MIDDQCLQKTIILYFLKSQYLSNANSCPICKPAIDIIELLDCNKLLGVLFQSNFK